MYSSQTTLQTGVHNNAKQEHKTNHPREQRREHAERKQRHGGNEPSVRPESGQPRKAAEPEQKKVEIHFLHFFTGKLSTSRRFAARLTKGGIL